jgi:hypothetical protein
VIKYPTLAPDTHGVGNSSGYNFPNSSGFTYQAEAVHRCLAVGLLECPQYTQEESLCVTKILDGACLACVLFGMRTLTFGSSCVQAFRQRSRLNRSPLKRQILCLTVSFPPCPAQP